MSGSLGYRSDLATKGNVARLEWLVDHLFKDSRLWPNEECEYYLGKLLKFEDLIEGDEEQKRRAVLAWRRAGRLPASDWQDGSTDK